MHARIMMVGIMLACGTTGATAQDVIWRAAKAATAPATPVASLGTPRPLPAVAPDEAAAPVQTVGPGMPRIVRAQAGANPPPPPPAFPGPAGGPAPFTPVPVGNPYDYGVVNNDADLGASGHAAALGSNAVGVMSPVLLATPFAPGATNKMFQSDCEFRSFSSPVTNPFFFEDPRSLTEFRPVFMWQHMPTSNAVTGGGNNYVLAATGSVAFTPYFSFVVNRLGYDWTEPNQSSQYFQSHVGFSEILFGPKITFLRSEATKTVGAFGLTFDLPAGSPNVQQSTGGLALIPYFSIAQNFGKSDYGSFNFMNTDGYSFRTEGLRSESFFASFHLDYDVGNYHRFYPLIEMNYRRYTRSGSARQLDFEGSDIANYGSNDVAGNNELTLAIGTRIRITDNIQFGIAGEFNVLNNSTGGHLDQFRLTTDMIFRY